MTTPLHARITLSNPGELLAAVPHLLGFHPVDSLVVVTVHGEPGAGGIGMTARVDLPDPGQYARLAEQIARGPVARDDPNGVILAVVGGQGAAPDRPVDPSAESDDVDVPAQRSGSTTERPAAPPHEDLIAVVRSALDAVAVPVVFAAWTAEIAESNPWRTYGDGRSGRTPDPGSSPLAAAMAASGSVTFRSREELAELLAPESEEDLARRSARLTAMHERRDEDEPVAAAPGDPGRDVVQCVLGAINRTAAGFALTEEDLLRVLSAISDHRVRDLVLGTALTELAGPAEELWLALVRKAPDPERAEAAVLLAFSAYLRGDGALAAVALERAESSRPDHRLGVLLRRALDTGISPSALSAVAEDAAEDARILLAEDGLG